MTNLNNDLYQINSNQIEEIQKNIKYFFNKIECYFESKEMLFNDSKQISIEEILRNSPAHYSLIKMIEQFYILITKDRNWLKKFIAHYGIRFDWNTYQLWKSGKSYFTRKYDSTQCPSKWIIDIQEQMITLLQQIQLLLYLEFYTPEEDFKLFLKKNPVVDFNVKSNFVSKSFPSEKLDEIFKVIDFLLKISIESAIHTNYIIDTVKCMEAYRFIDESKIFDLLKKKEFFVRYRIEFLRLTPSHTRLEVPEEQEIVKVAEEFLMTYKGLVFSYNEYKKMLIAKYNACKIKL